MAQVTKKTLIGEALSIDEEIVPILMGIGMHCLGCPASQGESLEEAWFMVFGVDADELVKKINDFGFKVIILEITVAYATVIFL